MKLVVALLLALAAHSASAAQGCPATLDLIVPDLGAADRRAAQAYANCLTRPALVSVQGRMANMAACRANIPVQRSAQLESAMRQVDRAAMNLGDCKTRLKIKIKP